MKLKKPIWSIVIAILVFSTQPIFAQMSRTGGMTVMDIVDPGMVNSDLIFGKNKKNIQGSPFFGQEWVRGTVTDNTGKVHENLTLSYYNFADNLYMKNNDKAVLVNKNVVTQFTVWVGVKQHLFVKISTNTRDIYAEFVYNGKNKLYRHQAKNVERRGSSYNEEFFEVYSDKTILYLQLDGKKAEEVKLNKKFVLASFPNQTAQIEAFWKKEKIKLKSEDDLAKTLKFIDTL